MRDQFALGENVRVDGKFTDFVTGALIDPTTVKFAWKSDVLGTVTTLTYGIDGGLVRDSTGKYHSFIDTSGSSGWYFWRFYSTGAGQAAKWNKFYVEPNQIVPTTPTGAGVPIITGSRGGNAALASLLTALANLGLIIDGTAP